MSKELENLSERQSKNPDHNSPSNEQKPHKKDCCMVNVCCGTTPEPCEPEKELVFARPLVEKQCCTFEIYMTRCRVRWNDEGPQDRFAELMIAGYANEKEAVFPGLGQYVKVGETHSWVNMNKKIGSFKVEVGDQFPIYLRADVLEFEKGAAAGGADIGSNDFTQPMILLCGSNSIPKASISVLCHRTGIQQGSTALVDIEFAAFRIADSCC